MKEKERKDLEQQLKENTWLLQLLYEKADEIKKINHQIINKLIKR